MIADFKSPLGDLGVSGDDILPKIKGCLGFINFMKKY